MNIKIEFFGDEDVKALHKFSEMLSTIDGVCFLELFGEKMRVSDTSDSLVVPATLALTVELESVRKEYSKEELMRIAIDKLGKEWPWARGGDVLSVRFGVLPDEEDFMFYQQISGEFGDWHGVSKVVCTKQEYLEFDNDN